MKQALLVHGSKQTSVTVEETDGGGLIVWLENKPLFILKPIEEENRVWRNSPEIKQEWTFSDDDLPDNIEPQDRSLITMSDLRPSTPENAAYNWRLIVHRFPWLFAKDFEYKHAVKLAEQIATEQDTTGKAPAKIKSQLQLDLETIKPHLDEIIQDGQFVYGHQSSIARILGGKNDGGFRRNRVLPVEAALTKLISSATSTTSTSPGSNYLQFDLVQRVGSK